MSFFEEFGLFQNISKPSHIRQAGITFRQQDPDNQADKVTEADKNKVTDLSDQVIDDNDNANYNNIEDPEIVSVNLSTNTVVDGDDDPAPSMPCGKVGKKIKLNSKRSDDRRVADAICMHAELKKEQLEIMKRFVDAQQMIAEAKMLQAKALMKNN